MIVSNTKTCADTKSSHTLKVVIILGNIIVHALNNYPQTMSTLHFHTGTFNLAPFLESTIFFNWGITKKE